MIPGLGELMSAADAVKAFRAAQRLEAQGKLDEALAKRGEAALNAVGAIPFVGKIAKVPKIAGKFKRFFRKADNAPKSRKARRIRSIDQLNGETTKAIDQLGMLRRQPQTAAAANLPFKKKTMTRCRTNAAPPPS